MRSFLWPIAALLVVPSCSDGPVDAPFGLDQRPSNPTCLAQPRPVVNTGVTLQRQWSTLTFSQPVFLLQAPGDSSQWFVVQREGKVRAFAGNATADSQVRDFVTVPVNSTGEGGLLGMAFHPQWPTKREVYLYYTRTPAAGDPAPVCLQTPVPQGGLVSIIARFQSKDAGATLDATSPIDEILKVGQPFTNHKGGTIEFGLDGMLYLGLGDGGSGNDPCGSGQNQSSLLGKMLRFDVNAPKGMYNVPADNPFAGVSGARGEIWSYGHRNPFRWHFDRVSGDLWVGDVGQDTWEEVDRVVKGGNYGWNTCEGFHQRGSTTTLCNTPGLSDPAVEHPRAEAQSITGGAVYRGSAMPSLVGTYIYGDYITGTIWALTYDASNKPVPRPIASVSGRSTASFPSWCRAACSPRTASRSCCRRPAASTPRIRPGRRPG
jgi:glucose/arabinose dehydrogenase